MGAGRRLTPISYRLVWPDSRPAAACSLLGSGTCKTGRYWIAAGRRSSTQREASRQPRTLTAVILVILRAGANYIICSIHDSVKIVMPTPGSSFYPDDPAAPFRS